MSELLHFIFLFAIFFIVIACGVMSGDKTVKTGTWDYEFFGSVMHTLLEAGSTLTAVFVRAMTSPPLFVIFIIILILLFK